MRRCLRCFAAVAMLLAAAVVQAREPTDLEQYFLEVVNRARADPPAEVVRLAGEIWGDDRSVPPVSTTPNLNEGLASGTISPAPKPPLAFEVRLVDSASAYADYLLAVEKFGHTENGTPLSRMQAAGYPFGPAFFSGENLGSTGRFPSNPLDKDAVNQHHIGLFVDWKVPGRGHRISLMKANFREVGIAIREDLDGQSMFEPGYRDIVSVQNFASTTGRMFVTGVIYHDSNANHFYDPGESAGALGLEVRTLGGAMVRSGTTFASGGYSINLADLAPGTYLLVADGGGGGVETKEFHWGRTQNVKVDLVNPAFLSPPIVEDPQAPGPIFVDPGSSDPIFGTPSFPQFRPDLRIGRSATSLTGRGVYSNSATGQLVKLTARNTRALVWHAALENSANRDDTVRTSASRGNRQFAVKYLRRNGSSFANATAALVAGRSEALQSRAEIAYQISVKPGRTALGRRAGLSFHLRAVSQGDASKADRVNGTLVNRTKKSQSGRR